MIPASTGKLSPGQLRKWIRERAQAILEVWQAGQRTECVGMLLSDNFGLSALLTATVMLNMDDGHRADLHVAMTESVARDHQRIRSHFVGHVRDDGKEGAE